MEQQMSKIANHDKQSSNSGSLENITSDLLTPKQAWKLIKIGKTRFYTLVEQGYINLIRFDYSGRKTFVRRSELTTLFPKDFVQN
jgi:hypothetical protein